MRPLSNTDRETETFDGTDITTDLSRIDENKENIRSSQLEPVDYASHLTMEGCSSSSSRINLDGNLSNDGILNDNIVDSMNNCEKQNDILKDNNKLEVVNGINDSNEGDSLFDISNIEYSFRISKPVEGIFPSPSTDNKTDSSINLSAKKVIPSTTNNIIETFSPHNNQKKTELDNADTLYYTSESEDSLAQIPEIYSHSCASSIDSNDQRVTECDNINFMLGPISNSIGHTNDDDDNNDNGSSILGADDIYTGDNDNDDNDFGEDQNTTNIEVHDVRPFTEVNATSYSAEPRSSIYSNTSESASSSTPNSPKIPPRVAPKPIYIYNPPTETLPTSENLTSEIGEHESLALRELDDMLQHHVLISDDDHDHGYDGGGVECDNTTIPYRSSGRAWNSST